MDLRLILRSACQDRLPYLPRHRHHRLTEAGGTLENAQAMAAHESPRTTKLYDRTDDEITLDEVERITAANSLTLDIRRRPLTFASERKLMSHAYQLLL